MGRVEVVFIVPYSHIDWGWGYYLGPSMRYIHRANAKVVAEALRVIRERAEYRWSGVDKVYSLVGFWLERPDLRDEFRECVRRGVVDIACAMVSTPHLLGISATHCCGESLIRNIVYGRELMERILGLKFRNVVLQLNDVTGLFSQLPQIALKCGFKYLKFERPKTVYDERGLPLEFWWEAPDGSRVLCCRVPYGSAWKPGLFKSFEECAESFREAVEGLSKFCRSGLLLFYQGGDWDPPYEELVDFVEEWNRRGLRPRLRISTPTEYFETLSEVAGDLPVVRGSLDNVSWAALYGISGDDTRRLQREVVDLLLTCEKFLTIASLMGLPYPEEELKQLWVAEVLWEDHNTVGYLYPEDLEGFFDDIRRVRERGEELLRAALRAIAGRVKRPDFECVPVVVFNQLSWDRSDVVEARVAFGPFTCYRHFKILDTGGREVPYEVLSERRYPDGSLREAVVLFRAEAPALGYSTYYVVPSEERPSYETQLRCYETQEAGATSYVLENQYFRVRVANGHVTSIVDKRSGRELIEAEAWHRLRGLGRLLGNSILCERVRSGPMGLTGEVVGLHYSSSEFSPDGVELELGPVRATIRARFSYLENPTTLEVTLYEGVPRVEFRTVIDARAVGRRFRAAFPLSVVGGELCVDKPFGVERVDPERELYVGGERSEGRMGRVVGAYSWADLSNGEYGVALVSRQNAGFMLEGRVLSSILLSTVNPDALYRFRNAPKMVGTGVHELEYALCPHDGDALRGRVYQRAMEYLNPLIALAGVVGSGDLPPRYSFLRIEADNVVLSALFRDKGEVAVRLFEVEGRGTRCPLRFFRELKKLRETNFLGETIRRVEGALEFRPCEIKEVRGSAG